MSTIRFVDAQIMYSRLAAICAEGTATFQRISRSTLVADDGRLAAGIVGADGALLVQTQGEPSHLFALRESVRRLLDYFAFDIADGDALAVADPYFGGTEGNVITVAVPTFHDGQVVAVPALRFAVPDLGGEAPGALQPEAHEIWREALRLTPLKLDRGGVPQHDIRAYLFLNSRTPDVLKSDLRSAIATCQRIGQLISGLVTDGGAALTTSARMMIGYAHDRTARRLAAMIPKPVSHRSRIVLPDGEAAEIHVGIRQRDGGLKIDFTGSSETVRGPFNLAAEATKAAACLPLVGELIDQMAVSDGLLDAFRFILPEDTLVNPAFPAAVNLGWRTTAHAVAAAIARAQHGSDSEEQAPFIDGPQPGVVLFPKVGTVGDQGPIYLSPGFAPTRGCGGPAIHGTQRLSSAEELETGGTVRMVHRKLTPDGDMAVAVKVLRGGLEATFLRPYTGNGQPAADLDIDGAGGGPAGTPGVRWLGEGDMLTFLFPRTDGGSGVEP